jgi:hypothetical protein
MAASAARPDETGGSRKERDMKIKRMLIAVAAALILAPGSPLYA